MQEIWKDIEKYEGLYQISNLGNVKSVERKVKNNNGYRKIKERILKPSISNSGYYLVALSKNCKMHTYSIHKLVMEHFNRCAFNCEVINHKDHNKLNNNIENLEYVTQKENIAKEIEIGNWSNKKVAQFDFNNNLINKYSSMSEASKSTKVSSGDISKCCRNIRNSAGGYIWKVI